MVQELDLDELRATYDHPADKSVIELIDRLEQAEQAVQRVRELAGKGTDALLRMNIRSDGLYLSQAILEALDGDGRE